LNESGKYEAVDRFDGHFADIRILSCQSWRTCQLDGEKIICRHLPKGYPVVEVNEQHMITISNMPTTVASIFSLNDELIDIIFSYLRPKDLLQTLSTGKSVKRLITMNRAIRCTLRSGRHAIQSLDNIHRLHQARAIHPITISRVLRLGCARRCELCRVKKVAKSRPQWGVVACWECLNLQKVNKRWYKTGYDHVKLNSYHKRHSDTLFRIFQHDQCIAYPYGHRRESSGGVKTSDGFEILWSNPVKDREGNYVGPVLTYDMIKPMVNHIETDPAHTISQFLHIHSPGDINEARYKLFNEAYIEESKSAEYTSRYKQNEKSYKQFMSRSKKIDRVLDALYKVLSFINERHLNSSPNFLHQATKERTSILRRLLLCYHEEYNMSMKHCLTFDTGLLQLDRELHNDSLKEILQTPSTMNTKKAMAIANDLYHRYSWLLSEQASMSAGIRCLFLNGRLLTTFGARYKPKYKQRPRRFKQWSDTSSNRRP